jgi:very-short-patch-repair endonuclease
MTTPSLDAANSSVTPASPVPAAPALSLVHDSALNYAFQQNAIPVVKELRFQNDAVARKDLVIRVSTEPAFAAPEELRIQSIEPNGEFRIAPLDLKLSPDFLAGLNEKVAGLLKVDVLASDLVLCSRTESVSLLARNEWCGLVSLPEILAAFILPNDPALMPILGRASDLLRETTGRSALNGYQDKSRKRAWDQIAAIYRAVAELGIRYINPPASFESTGQKVSFPAQIVAERFGTCLDLALLFAACCERSGLHPLVLMHEGHAYAGCWLEERTFPEPAAEGADALQQIRKHETESLLTVFETTLVAGEAPGVLADAERAARTHLQTEKPFRLALDVRRARIARIVPLPIPGQRAAETPNGPVTVDVVEGIGSRDFADPLAPSTPSSVRPATRIDQWKSRLLDLSLRNRLLNFRETKSTIRLLSAAPEHVEDELAAENELALRPRPKLMSEDDPRHGATLSKQQRADALAAHLADELQSGRLHTNLDEDEHARRLTELYRAARNALDENGTNTLFAAVGILEWRETEHSDRVFRAPLLLVPVELKRKSVLEGFSLRRLDEETRLNVTLMEMLRQHFQKDIAGLDPLPEDETGVNVARVFQLFRDAVRDLAGWEVKDDIWLGQFSFTKFLLWKDLADRLDDLTRNRIVNHLVNAAGTPYDNPPDDITPAHLDDQFHPRDVFCPRSADSSQLAAVMAAAAGHDFVLEGPPGTGKSQTITNIIAHCLAHGKRVLFVAEKRAALDVVHRRLREEGLEPFCLELHSNKIGKADVLAQFDRSLKFMTEATVDGWEHRTAELERLRAALNDYTRALHRRTPCGLSAHACFDYLLPRQNEPTVRVDDWPNLLETAAAELDNSRLLARQLQERSRAVMPLHDHPLAPLACEEWSPSWAERTPELIRALVAQTTVTAEATHELRTWLRCPGESVSRRQLQDLRALTESLAAPEPVGPAFATTPWPQLEADLDRWIPLVRERAAVRSRLGGYDEAKLLALDLDALKAKWTLAQSSWFLMKWLRIGSVRRMLRTTRPDQSRPEVAQLGENLDDALRLRTINTELAAAAPIALACLGAVWAKGEPDPEALAKARTWGEALHARMLACASDDLVWLGQLRQLLAALFAEGPSAFTAGTAIGLRLSCFREALVAFEATLERFAAEVKLRREVVDEAPDHLAAVRTLAERVSAAWRHIREWCSWQKARRTAVETGLASVIATLESPEGAALEVPALFERSFRRALLFARIEREPALREFFGREHNERIERFRELDEKIASLSREIIRARLAAGIPRDQGIADVPKAEIGLLRKELGKRMRHIPVRKLLAGIPKLLPRLKPCVLMSPLSVAQYLEATHETFDLVIFDEASQIPVWDAIGAIARGKQLIMVGDPKQLPPTNFFGSGNDDEDDLTPETHKDLESVLDELMSHQVRHKRLRWHYRSRHEGLITFSNRQYYENDLLTFPSPESGLGGVRMKHLPQARYDKGKSRTNLGEARALVDELVTRLRTTDGPRRSYGIVTFSLAQQQLVENLLDEERRKYPEIESHFGDEPPVEGEPVFVKNLENVQGDERDVILFSICYGPDEAGKVAMNFGPLNRDGGERRLNVAITRAKHEVLVFSGLRADQIDLTRTRARGVRDLKLFLEYAERGPKALVAATTTTGSAEADSEFEKMVADRLRAAGHEVHHQVGCSGYRIDLAVVDPTAPGRYLLGIECDDATYHRAATARDRDKLRQLILEGLGWKLHRIWSTDWWHNADKETEKLLQRLKEMHPPKTNPSPASTAPDNQGRN